MPTGPGRKKRRRATLRSTSLRPSCTDGKLIINGGEYDQCVGKETTKGAIYDPVANTWTNVNPPSGWSQIGDAQSVILNDGTYMIGNCCTSAQAQYNESTGAWTAVGNGKHDSNSEEGWTLLANGTVLAADVLAEPNSEAFDPSTNMWSSTGSVGIQPDRRARKSARKRCFPDGKVWVAGGNGLSAVYNSKTKSWKAGPDLPGCRQPTARRRRRTVHGAHRRFAY